MKFPYISGMPLIAEVQAQFKKLNQTGDLDDDTCYQYLSEAVRLIGGHHWEKHTVFLGIKNHICPLPVDFYTCEAIYRCDQGGYAINQSGVILTDGTTLNFARRTRMIPVEDEGTLRFMEPDEQFYDMAIGAAVETYVFQIPPRIIQTSFKTGVAELKYSRLKTETVGHHVRPMVQDQEDTIKAIKNYILQESLKEQYILGKIPRYVYKDIEADCDKYIGIAQNVMMADDPMTFNTRAARQAGKHKKFDL